MRHPMSALVLALSLSPGASAVAPPTPTPPAGHWAFRAPVRPAPPRGSGRARNPVDAFILARLKRVGLSLAPPADRLTQLRRAAFSLTGLPPAPEEAARFLADDRPDAYERAVERLLASPHHGERWAQHWLDVVRYADTNGYEADGERPQAWRYRDYVVRAFNRDRPYDRFLTEQLAGDLLARKAPASERADLLIAVGMNRCGPVHQVGGNVDPAVNRNEVLNEMVSGVGSALLGLTIGCARCHDHKFDPVSQKEYYRLEAFFSAARYAEVDLAGPAERALHARRLAILRARQVPLNAKIAALEAPYRQRLRETKRARLPAEQRAALALAAEKRTPAQRKIAAEAEASLRLSWDEVVAALSPADREARAALRQQFHALAAAAPAPPAQAWALEEGRGALASHVLRRGDPLRKGLRVFPAFPVALAKGERVAPADRLDLARWMVRPDHPLTARVIVNRLWQHHFGQGLVRTPNDFGLRGEAPSNPELLDWLAVELVQSGWSLKHVHRLIVLSATFRQSSRSADARARQVDPDNRLLARMNRRRLEGEALRDSALAVAGTFTPRLGGPAVRVPLEPEVYDLIFTEGEPDGLWHVTPDAREHARRSLYLLNKRNVRLPLLESLDQPDTLTSCPVRPISTFAPQALILLNGPFVQEQARALALRVLREGGSTNESRIARAYWLALSRPPRLIETKLALAFLKEQSELLRDRLRARLPVGAPEGAPADVGPAEAAALADFCLALLNCNGFAHY